MSDKLWNQSIKKKTHDWKSMEAEFRKIIGSIEDEDRLRKQVIIATFIAHKRDEIWDLIDRDYFILYRERNDDLSRMYRKDLEEIAAEHNKEFTKSGPSAWLVDYELPPETEQEEHDCCS